MLMEWIISLSYYLLLLLHYFLSSCDFVSEHLDPINVKIAELREALESVVAEQKYLKARDSRHRHSKMFPLFLSFTRVLLCVGVMTLFGHSTY